jgi:chemotaxis protein methyltransferase CheR
VCKRIGRRIRELGLEGHEAYRNHLEAHPDEWSRLDSMCRITISRLWRDRAVFDSLMGDVIPTLTRSALDRGDDILRCWTCGCASGEEPHSLRIGWDTTLAERFSSASLEIVATDSDPAMLERARRAVYSRGSLRDLPARCHTVAFEFEGRSYLLRDRFKMGVTWLCQDVREQTPKGPFDLVLCRNLVFTYFEESLQRETAHRLAEVLRPGGALTIGFHEELPFHVHEFEPWTPHRALYRRRL